MYYIVLLLYFFLLCWWTDKLVLDKTIPNACLQEQDWETNQSCTSITVNKSQGFISYNNLKWQLNILYKL